MQWYWILFTTFFIIFVCLSINDSYSNTEFNDNSLQSFSSKARFQPPPDGIDIPDYSKSMKLQKCQLSGLNPCSKYPNTSCTHFGEKIKVHFDTDGLKQKFIEINNPDEGYCINVQNIGQYCNEFHGDWVLIKKSNEEHSYMRVCLCKRPGLIGNDKLFGPCECPFICNGQVKDINVDIKDIKCICKKNEVNDIRNDIPICRPAGLQDILNWRSVILPPELKDNFISADAFDKTIRGNINNLDQLIDPCSICPLTGQKTGGRAIHGLGSVFCSTTKRNWGIPFQRGTSRLLHGNFGPDGVLAVEWDRILIYDDAAQNDNAQKFMYMINPSANNSKFYDALNLDYNQYAINVGANNYLGVTILPRASFTPCLLAYTERNIYGGALGTYIRSNSITHDNISRHLIGKYHVNEAEGNLISTVIIRTEDEPLYKTFEALAAPLVKKAHKNGFDYVTYNQFLLNSQIKDKFDFKAMCIRPLTDADIHGSNWSGHKNGELHYFVEFLKPI